MTTDTEEPDFAALPALDQPVAEASRICTKFRFEELQ